MQLSIFVLILCVSFALIIFASSNQSPHQSPKPTGEEVEKGGVAPLLPPALAPALAPASPTYGPHYPSCTGACTNCLKPGWCHSERCGQCTCLDSKVCVPANEISCATSHGSVVTLLDQDVVTPEGANDIVHLACTVTPDGRALWLPRCDASHSCPGEGWACNSKRYTGVDGKEVFLCFPK